MAPHHAGNLAPLDFYGRRSRACRSRFSAFFRSAAHCLRRIEPLDGGWPRAVDICVGSSAEVSRVIVTAEALMRFMLIVCAALACGLPTYAAAPTAPTKESTSINVKTSNDLAESLHHHAIQQDQFRAVEFLHRFCAGHPPNECSEFGWHQDLPSQPSAETQRDDEGIRHLGAGRSFAPGAVGERRLPAVHGGTISLPVESSSDCLRRRISTLALTWHFAGLGEYPLEIAHEPIAGHRALHQHAAPI